MLLLDLIPQSSNETKQWSGGITKQILIDPNGALFRQNNFRLRISQADVEVEESDFSYMEGIQRAFILLQATSPSRKFELSIGKNIKFQEIKPFNVYSFSGEDPVKSRGKCKDFNVLFLSKIKHSKKS